MNKDTKRSESDEAPKLDKDFFRRARKMDGDKVLREAIPQGKRA